MRSLRWPAWALLVPLLGSCAAEGAPGDFVHLSGVVPAITALPPSASLDFVSGDSTGSPVPATWSVNGIPGGNDSLGHVTASGHYTAPRVLPGIDSVVIVAHSISDAGVSSATLFFLPAAAASDFVTTFPRVVDATASGVLHVFIVELGKGVSSVQFVTADGVRTLPQVSDGIFLLDLPHSEASAGYLQGSLHNTLGFLHYRNSGGEFKRANFSVNVSDAGIDPVPITPLAADAQNSPHLINIRVDRAWDQATDKGVIARAIQLLGDRFDQVLLITNVDRNSNRFHETVRNSITGIGQVHLDFGAIYGSPARLQGVSYFPLSAYFDGADIAVNHEIGHQWINFMTTGPLAAGVPHWPPSSIANDVMGFSIGGQGGAGGEFPFTLDSLGGGLYQVIPAPASQLYGPWDLYLMGLLPADSVPPALILPANYSAAPTTVTRYTIAQYVADNGPRVPAHGLAPTEFRVATIVMSYGRLLSPIEMAFFDANAARGEATVPLLYSIGLGQGLSLPFFLATGGRASLHMGVE